MSAKKVNRRSIEFYSIAAITLFLLLFTAININSYLKPKTNTVLAAETETSDTEFWQNFLSENPDYIPGWVELGRPDKVQKIDPNYLGP